MADAPTPPPPPSPPEGRKPRARRSPPRHADVAKPARSRAAGSPAKRKAAAPPARVESAEPAATGDRFGWKTVTAAAVAAIGALAGAALLTLRGSTPRKTAGRNAHQADGTDSSASFDAEIADEGTIPETKDE